MKGLESDVDLVEGALAGNRKAFEGLVKRYQGPVYNAAFRVTGNSEDARDVAQSTFFKVAQRLGDYDRQHKFFSWIFRIAINESINFVERRRPEDAGDDDVEFEAPDGANPERQYEQRQASDRIQRALRAMSSDDRAVITLRHFSDCSYEEMARILSIEEKTVRSRLFEARRRLGQRLSDLKVR